MATSPSHPDVCIRGQVYARAEERPPESNREVADERGLEGEIATAMCSGWVYYGRDSFPEGNCRHARIG